MSKKRDSQWDPQEYIQLVTEDLAEAKRSGENTVGLKRLLKQLKNPRWQREHQERIRLAKEEIAEATLIGDVERARLAKGKLRHLEDPTSYRSEESWNAFVESGKDYDVWLEERRQKVKETGYCDCCDQWDEAAAHRWN